MYDQVLCLSGESGVGVKICKAPTQHYTQFKKMVNTENIPGMCVLTNHVRDLVTTENEWVLSHGIELFRKTTRFNLHQFIVGAVYMEQGSS